MRKITLLSMVIVVSMLITACGSSTGKSDTVNTGTTNERISEDAANQSAEESKKGNTDKSKSKALVAYFSYADNAEFPDDIDASSSASIQNWGDEITGNTGVVAHMISEAAGADLFSIQTVEKYPPTYDEAIDQGQQEKEDNARPELANRIENLEQYDTVFIGFPTWWYDMPMAMYSFFEEYDFSGKTIYMFCTSGGSEFLDTTDSVKKLEPDAEVIEGISIGDSSSLDAENEIKDWIQELGFR